MFGVLTTASRHMPHETPSASRIGLPRWCGFPRARLALAEPTAEMNGDTISDIFAQLLAQFRVQREHMPTPARDHETNVGERDSVDSRVDSDSAPCTKKFCRIWHLDTRPYLAFYLDADRRSEAVIKWNRINRHRST